MCEQASEWMKVWELNCLIQSVSPGKTLSDWQNCGRGLKYSNWCNYSPVAELLVYHFSAGTHLLNVIYRKRKAFSKQTLLLLNKYYSRAATSQALDDTLTRLLSFNRSYTTPLFSHTDTNKVHDLLRKCKATFFLVDKDWKIFVCITFILQIKSTDSWR